MSRIFDQLGPALLRAQRRPIAAQRAVLDRVRLQRLLVVGQRLIRTAQLLGQLARGELGDGAVVAVLRLLGAAAVEVEQLVLLAGVAQQALEVLARRRLRGSSSRLLRRKRSPSSRLVGRTSAGTRRPRGKARRQRRVRRASGLLQVALRDRLPVALDQPHLRLRLERGRVVGHGLERLAHARLPLASRRSSSLRMRPFSCSRSARFGASMVHASSRSMSCTQSSKSPRSRWKRRASVSACASAASTPLRCRDGALRGAERLLVVGVELKGFEALETSVVIAKVAATRPEQDADYKPSAFRGSMTKIRARSRAAGRRGTYSMLVTYNAACAPDFIAASNPSSPAAPPARRSWHDCAPRARVPARLPVPGGDQRAGAAIPWLLKTAIDALRRTRRGAGGRQVTPRST